MWLSHHHLFLVVISSLYTAAYDKIDWWLWPLWPFPPPPRGPPTLRPPTSCWPLKWDPDVAIVMCEIPMFVRGWVLLLYLSIRWREIKWSPEECFEDVMLIRWGFARLWTTCPVAFQGALPLPLPLPLPLYLYGIFSMRKTIMNKQY